MPDRRNSLQPIADTLESSSIEDVTEVTAARDRIADRLNRVDSSDSIESLLSHSDVDSGGGTIPVPVMVFVPRVPLFLLAFESSVEIPISA